MQEAWVQSLGQEDPLEEEMAIHSSILAWEIPGTEEPGGLQSMESKKSGTRLSDLTTTLGSMCVMIHQAFLYHPSPTLSDSQISEHLTLSSPHFRFAFSF